MTKGNLINVIGFVLCILVIAGCSKTPDSHNCLSYVKAGVIKVEGPHTGSVNQAINLAVSFGCYNGCGQFGNFEQGAQADTTTINVIAKYEGCICTMDAPVRQATYTFKASRPGIYYVKFLQADQTYLIHSISIQ